ncbi:MAG: TRAP transporter substrate-binding protein [Deltaproteobacteria bacterium]|nr:TRAP transporter substrate-binding protein [Deltaproteobacteria bacterium]
MLKNKSSKITKILLGMFVLSLLFLGRFTIQTTEAADGSRTLTLANELPGHAYQSRTVDFFIEQVEKRTNGSVKIKPHHGGSLLNGPGMYEGVSNRVVDLALIPYAFMGGSIPEINVFDYPGAFSLDKFLELQKEATPVLDEILKKHRMKHIFAVLDGGVTMAGKNTGPLKTAEDFKGLRVRAPGAAGGEIVKNFGGNPVSIPFPEIATALQLGTIDVIFTGWPQVHSLKLYEFAKDITVTNLSTLWNALTFNLDAWNDLSPEQQKIILECGYEAEKKSEELAKQEFQLFRAAVEKEANLYLLKNDEMGHYNQVTRNMRDYTLSKFGKYDLTLKLQGILDKYK